MAGHKTVASEAEIYALRDTLCAQQQLLQRLHGELEAEREASATAASEALSVILRLQAEKAAVTMESEQYKRLSEEKMCHAEESFAIIEDIIYQKDMEISALNYQVQAYMCKLLSMGCTDLGLGEPKDDIVAGETGLQRISASPVGYKKAASEELISKIGEEQTEQEMALKASDSWKIDDHSDFYWESIRKLDLRVEEIAGSSNTISRSNARSPSSLSSSTSSCNRGKELQLPSPQIISSNSYDRSIKDKTDHIMQCSNGVGVDNPCSTNVHDVFEVPQVVRESLAKFNCEADVAVHPEIDKVHAAKGGTEWLKRVVQSTPNEKDMCLPNDFSPIECHFAAVQSGSGMTESLPRLHQFNTNTEISEVERSVDSSKREEEFKLLNEIKEQLHSLRKEIRSWKAKKSSARDDPSLSLCALKEAMLYFWL